MFQSDNEIKQQHSEKSHQASKIAATFTSTSTQLDSALITSNPAAHFSDWSSSLIRPASRFSISTRRECKSTSDEPFTFDISHEIETSGITKHAATNDTNNNTNAAAIGCLVSPIRNSTFNKFNSSSSSSAIKNPMLEGILSNISTKIALGRFGFNPFTGSATAASVTNPTPTSFVNLNKETTNKLAQKLNFTPHSHYSNTNTPNGSHHSNNNKKNVKRLSNNLRLNMDSKKNSEFNHNKKLFHAISNNDFNTVTNLLDTNMYDVNCYDDKQRTCLHIASSRGYLEIVRLLLNYGANPNLRDCVSNLPIHLAIIASHVPVVTVLLEAGTDIHSLDLNGKTVLHLAGTRLRWLLNDENHKASPKLKFEAIMIMNMIKEYLRRKRTPTTDLDMLASKLESVFNLDDINSVTKEFLEKFEILDLK